MSEEGRVLRHKHELTIHEFAEDVNDASMCRCGIPALSHDAIYGAAQPTTDPGEGSV